MLFIRVRIARPAARVKWDENPLTIDRRLAAKEWIFTGVHDKNENWHLRPAVIPVQDDRSKVIPVLNSAGNPEKWGYNSFPLPCYFQRQYSLVPVSFLTSATKIIHQSKTEVCLT